MFYEGTVGIESTAHALPQRNVTSRSIADLHGMDLEFIERKLGISDRRVMQDDDTVSALAVEAVNRLLRRTARTPPDIQALIVVTQTPDYSLPHTSALVQARASLPSDALVFDVGLGCSGYVIGLSVMKSILQSMGLDQGILVTVDAYSRIVDPADRVTSPLFGDAASATLITTQPLYAIGESTHGSDGAKHEALILRGSGSAPGESEPLFMDGRAIFSFALSTVPGDVALCLERNSLAIGDIDLFVFHQANRYIIEALAQRIGIPMDRVVMSMSDVGNTTSSSIPIALEREVLTRDPLPESVLICGFGVGLSWGSSVLTRVGGKSRAR